MKFVLLALLIAVAVHVGLAENVPDSCTGFACCKGNKNLIMTCRAPTALEVGYYGSVDWTQPLGSNTVPPRTQPGWPYGDKYDGWQSQCCCCTGGTGDNFGTIKAFGDIRSTNDERFPPFDVRPPGVVENAFLKNSDWTPGNKGWCQQVLTSGQWAQIDNPPAPGPEGCRTQDIPSKRRMLLEFGGMIGTHNRHLLTQNCRGSHQWCPSIQYGPPVTCPGCSTNDPHVGGFDGTEIEFNGVSGSSFAFVSDPETQINTELDTFDMSEATFIRAVGVKHAASNTTVVVESPYKTCKGGMPKNISTDVILVTVNGQSVDINKGEIVVNKGRIISNARSAAANVVKLEKSRGFDGASVVLRVGAWAITVERMDQGCHLNMYLTLTKPIDVNKCGGILCETLQWQADPTMPKLLKGDELSYMVDSLLGHEFAYSFYGKEQANNRRMLSDVPRPSRPLNAFYKSGAARSQY